MKKTKKGTKGKAKRHGLIEKFYRTAFMRSLDLDKRYFMVLLLDILFVVGLLAAVSIFKHLLNFYAMQANAIAPQAIKVFEFMNDPRIQATPEIMGEVYEGVFLLEAVLERFLWKILATIAALATFVVFLISLLKGYAWKEIKKQPFTKVYLRKFFLMNLAWFGAAIALFFSSLFLLKAPLDILLAQLWIVVFLYLVMVMHAAFTEQKSTWQNTRHALYLATARFPAFLPLLFAFAFFFAVIMLFSGVLFSVPLYFGLQLSLEVVFLVLLAVFLMETAWIKFYYHEIYKKLQG